jgi:hypothetical protein
MSTVSFKDEDFKIENIKKYSSTITSQEMLGGLVLLSEEKEAGSNIGYTDLKAQYAAQIWRKVCFV